MVRRVVSAWLSSCVVAASAPAFASDAFPLAIHLRLDTRRLPDCAICHNGDSQGRGTVITPFGLAMRARGLVAGDEESLGRALDALRADGHDSDHDGLADVEELVEGRDPNGDVGDYLAPSFGCADVRVRSADGDSSTASLASGLAGLAWVLSRNRRATPPPSRVKRQRPPT